MISPFRNSLKMTKVKSGAKTCFRRKSNVTVMNYDYKEVIKEVVGKARIPKEYVFDFSDHELKQLFDDFFQQCQYNLDNEKPFVIKPCKLFIGPDETVNAWALKRNGYYLMCINLGLFI